MSTTCRIDIQKYKDTYGTTLRVLSKVGLRLTKDDSLSKWCRIFFWSTFISLFFEGVLELAYMAQVARGGTFDDTVAVFTMMPCFGFVVLGLTKAYKTATYQPVFERLIQELGLMWPTGDLTEEEHSVVQKDLKKLNTVISGYYWCNNALIAFYLCRPYIAIIKRCLGYDVPLTLPFFYWVPFDPLERGYYEFMLLLQTWHGAIVVWWGYGGDMLYCTFLTHITTNFDLMSLRIKNLIHVPVDRQLLKEFPLGKTSQVKTTSLSKCLLVPMATTEDYFVNELKIILQRHRDLIRLSETVEELFSFSLLVNFCYSSIIICFCGFCCIMVEKWNEIVYKLFLLTALAQTWLFCWYGNRLYESSRGVSDALYSCGWYTCSKKIKIPLLIMIQRAQKNIRLTTYGFSTISLGTLTTILKTSWSYFTLLLHFYKHKP